MKKVYDSFKQYFPSLLTKVILIFLCITGMMVLIQGCAGPNTNDGNTNTGNDGPGNGDQPELLPLARVSVNDAGVQADNYSYRASLNAGGSLVAFYSRAGNLVDNDKNNANDIYVYNRETKKVKLVSIAYTGEAGNGNSIQPVISANGRYIAYQSTASNLVAGDSNRACDIFVYDRQEDKTILASVNSDKTQGNGDSTNPVISSDGHFVAFESKANNLVDGDTNNVQDIFVHNTQTGQTERVSVASTVEGVAGAPANAACYVPAISADGLIVAFCSQANNLVSDDKIGAYDIFVYDRTSQATERCSLGTGGAEANANSLNVSINADGHFVAFESYASNLVPGDVNGKCDIFVFDRQAKTTERVTVNDNGSQATDHSNMPYISASGRYVAFQSYASKLVWGDGNQCLDIFIRDRINGTTKLFSKNEQGTLGNKESTDAAISADGNYLSFQSEADNLVAEDTNNVFDIFVVPIK